MRMPSSFHSTDERSKPSTASPALAAVEASIGRIGRKISRPTSRSPSSPLVSASSAVCVRSPESMSARRASGPGTPAAFATASIISPASAPWRSSPVKRRLMKLRLWLGGAREQLGQQLLAPGGRPRAGTCPAPRRSRDRARRSRATARPRARPRSRRSSCSRHRRAPDAARRSGSRRRAPPHPARACRSSSARIAIFCERELVAATASDAATTSASECHLRERDRRVTCSGPSWPDILRRAQRG